ncbi:MAG: Hsp20/alpha crystallin family protein [Deltaproteobacteria bacterium]|nr:Hsp20/alpha crystallin family protein [Deltaproteobacteria bacterium]
MADTENKALQAKEKLEITGQAEQSRPGLVFNPTVDIFETDNEITLMADIPGAKAEDLNIDLHDSLLTLEVDVKSPEEPDEEDIFREYRTGKYFRQFRLSQVIDQSKIDAELKDGVLGLRLPKVEAATPRRISVRTS